MIIGKNGKWMWVSSKGACVQAVVERCPRLVSYTQPRIAELDALVNGAGFKFSIGRMGLANADTGDCELEHIFWNEISKLNPLAYLADNGTLLFATTDDLLFEEVALAIQDEEFEIERACDARSTIGPDSSAAN